MKEGATTQCGGCRGQGVRIVVQRIGPGMITQTQAVCPDCRGSGESIRDADKCKDCKGKKTIQETKDVEVHVEPGMIPGSKVTFYNEADEQPGMETGDLVVVLVPKEEDDKDDEEGKAKKKTSPTQHTVYSNPKDIPRPKFKRLQNGSDLFIEAHISLVEALLGFEFPIKHMDDRIVIISGKDRVYNNEDVVVVEGEGMPKHKDNAHRGDLYVKLNVVMPTHEEISGAKKAKALREVLPPSIHAITPEVAKDADVVDARPYDPEVAKAKARQQRAEAYEEDDDHRQGGTSCKPM